MKAYNNIIIGVMFIVLIFVMFVSLLGYHDKSECAEVQVSPLW